MKKLFLSILFTALCFGLALPLASAPAYAIGSDAAIGVDKAFEGLTTLPAGAQVDPREIAKKIIGLVSGFLGIISVIIILIAGFQWMTAGGNEEQVGKATKMLFQGVIGLILILATWSVAFFVIDQLTKQITQSS